VAKHDQANDLWEPNGVLSPRLKGVFNLRYRSFQIRTLELDNHIDDLFHSDDVISLSASGPLVVAPIVADFSELSAA
jgi:hypothetical protein